MSDTAKTVVITGAGSGGGAPGTPRVHRTVPYA